MKKNILLLFACLLASASFKCFALPYNAGATLSISGTSGGLITDSSIVSTADVIKREITITIDGGGVALTTGAKQVYVRIPYDMTLTGWDIVADQSGSVVVDIWKDTYANFPPTVADTIAASAKPTLSTATKNTNSTLVGWTTTITAGDYIEANVDSATTVTKVIVHLYGVTR